MLKNIVALLGSLAVSLLVTASGIYFDVKVLASAGVILLAVVIVAWLILWAAPFRKEDPDKQLEERRRELIKASRKLVTRYTQSQTDRSFRQYLEHSTPYPELRPNLSDAYLAELNAPRASHSSDGAGAYEPLAKMFLDDLDRLEAEWRLR